MKWTVCVIFLAVPALAQQDLRDPSRSTGVPSNGGVSSSADVARQLGALNERISGIKESLDRIEREQRQLSADMNQVKIDRVAAASKEQGRKEESDDHFKWLSTVGVPLVAAILGTMGTLYVARRSGADGDAPTIEKKMTERRRKK